MSRTCPDCQNRYEDEVAHCPEDGLDLSKVPQDDELIGRSIGSYQVVKPLGKGGMGAVYMAEHPVIGSKVAIKFLHPQYSTDAKIVDRFFNEARAVNVIGHDNILKILDLNVTEDNRHYFVMEFLYGKALQELVKPDVPVPLEIAGPILLQTCEALQAAHDHNIIHRDLKPDNIYLIAHKGRKNFVKVVDFGIAKLTDEQGQSTGQTQTGMVLGTPAYMSPEQAGGVTSSINGRSDIYSLGCMMFQMATGKVPFPGTSFGQVLIGHLQQQPPAPRSLNPGIFEDYEAVILKTLEKQQESRYQTMKELHDAIGAVLDAHGITRELPIADAQEIAARSQGPKARTGPGTKLSKPKPPLAKKPATNPEQEPATVALAPPAPPPRSNVGVIAAIAISVMVLAAGTVGAVLWQSHHTQMAAQAAAELAAQRAAEETRRATEAVRAEQERKKAEEKKLALTQPAILTIDSDPAGATVDASWKDQKQTGQTPLKLYVPPNSAVHLSFSKEGFAAVSRDLVADGPQQISIGLIVEKAGKKAPAARSGKPKVHKSEDPLDIEF
jgi:serine/threonine protein kinase